MLMGYVLDHVLDHKIIGLVTTLLQLPSCWRQLRRTSNCQKLFPTR